MNFAKYIKELEVKENTVALFWLGQAGFAFKTAKGTLIGLDPFLTDYVEKAIPEEGLAFRRLSPALCDPDEIEFDILLSSHEHEDHFDLDALPVFVACEKTKIYANADSIAKADAKGIDTSKINEVKAGDVVKFDEFTLTCTKADHGPLAPNAMGFILDFGFTKLYYSGDTCYNLDALKVAIDAQPEVVMLPINGAFGNLNAKDAAKLSKDLHAKVCVSHHFWTFAKHKGEGGDPIDAIECFPEIAPDVELALLTPGKAFICK